MKSAASLIALVKNIVKDKSFSDEFILEKLNDGLFEISDLTNPPSLMQHEVEFEVSAEEKAVSVPSDFFGSKIFGMYNQTEGIHCRVVYRLTDFVHLSRKYSSSSVRAACLKGRKLHLAGIPAKDTLFLLSYLSTPPTFTSTADDGSELEYLPPCVGENAIVAFAAKEIYAIIEDGVDGKMINTQKWERSYALEIAKIQERFGMESMELGPDQVADHMGITKAVIENTIGVI